MRCPCDCLPMNRSRLPPGQTQVCRKCSYPQRSDAATKHNELMAEVRAWERKAAAAVYGSVSPPSLQHGVLPAGAAACSLELPPRTTSGAPPAARRPSEKPPDGTSAEVLLRRRQHSVSLWTTADKPETIARAAATHLPPLSPQSHDCYYAKKKGTVSTSLTQAPAPANSSLRRRYSQQQQPVARCPSSQQLDCPRPPVVLPPPSPKVSADAPSLKPSFAEEGNRKRTRVPCESTSFPAPQQRSRGSSSIYGGRSTASTTAGTAEKPRCREATTGSCLPYYQTTSSGTQRRPAYPGADDAPRHVETTTTSSSEEGSGWWQSAPPSPDDDGGGPAPTAAAAGAVCGCRGARCPCCENTHVASRDRRRQSVCPAGGGGARRRWHSASGGRADWRSLAPPVVVAGAAPDPAGVDGSGSEVSGTTEVFYSRSISRERCIQELRRLQLDFERREFLRQMPRLLPSGKAAASVGALLNLRREASLTSPTTTDEGFSKQQPQQNPDLILVKKALRTIALENAALKEKLAQSKEHVSELSLQLEELRVEHDRRICGAVHTLRALLQHDEEAEEEDEAQLPGWAAQRIQQAVTSLETGSATRKLLPSLREKLPHIVLSSSPAVTIEERKRRDGHLINSNNPPLSTSARVEKSQRSSSLEENLPPPSHCTRVLESPAPDGGRSSSSSNRSSCKNHREADVQPIALPDNPRSPTAALQRNFPRNEPLPEDTSDETSNSSSDVDELPAPPPVSLKAIPPPRRV